MLVTADHVRACPLQRRGEDSVLLDTLDFSQQRAQRLVDLALRTTSGLVTVTSRDPLDLMST